MDRPAEPPALAPGERLVPATDAPVATLLAAATHVAVVAHPDDVELVAVPAVAACAGRTDRALVAIVCTDGAGSAPGEGHEADGDLVEVRADEQAAAARRGGYHVVLLGRTSAEVRDDPDGLAARLVALLGGSRPTMVATHDPFDRHDTHRAVATAAVAALRRRPPVDQVLGCEGWRGLDWLADEDRVGTDLAPVVDLLAELARCFPSQLAAKRYDRAVEGRWRANATFADAHVADATTHLAWSVDLTAACRAGGPTLEELRAGLRARALGG